jgi:hypothetical protein
MLEHKRALKIFPGVQSTGKLEMTP